MEPAPWIRVFAIIIARKWAGVDIVQMWLRVARSMVKNFAQRTLAPLCSLCFLSRVLHVPCTRRVRSLWIFGRCAFSKATRVATR
eukprot:7572907-Pyramimonas_sp.AAC.1